MRLNALTSNVSSSSSAPGDPRLLDELTRAVPRGSNGSTTTCSVPFISVLQNGHPCPSESCQEETYSLNMANWPFDYQQVTLYNMISHDTDLAICYWRMTYL